MWSRTRKRGEKKEGRKKWQSLAVAVEGSTLYNVVVISASSRTDVSYSCSHQSSHDAKKKEFSFAEIACSIDTNHIVTIVGGFYRYGSFFLFFAEFLHRSKALCTVLTVTRLPASICFHEWYLLTVTSIVHTRWWMTSRLHKNTFWIDGNPDSVEGARGEGRGDEVQKFSSSQRPFLLLRRRRSSRVSPSRWINDYKHQPGRVSGKWQEHRRLHS